MYLIPGIQQTKEVYVRYKTNGNVLYGYGRKRHTPTDEYRAQPWTHRHRHNIGHSSSKGHRTETHTKAPDVKQTQKDVHSTHKYMRESQKRPAKRTGRAPSSQPSTQRRMQGRRATPTLLPWSGAAATAPGVGWLKPRRRDLQREMVNVQT